jgi:hypothetical protein
MKQNCPGCQDRTAKPETDLAPDALRKGLRTGASCRMQTHPWPDCELRRAIELDQRLVPSHLQALGNLPRLPLPR